MTCIFYDFQGSFQRQYFTLYTLYTHYILYSSGGKFFKKFIFNRFEIFAAQKSIDF